MTEHSRELLQLLDRIREKEVEPPKKRMRKSSKEADPNLAKITTVSLYPEHIKKLDTLVELRSARGEKTNRSQVLRWLIDITDLNEFPDF